MRELHFSHQLMFESIKMQRIHRARRLHYSSQINGASNASVSVRPHFTCAAHSADERRREESHAAKSMHTVIEYISKTDCQTLLTAQCSLICANSISPNHIDSHKRPQTERLARCVRMIFSIFRFNCFGHVLFILFLFCGRLCAAERILFSMERSRSLITCKYPSVSLEWRKESKLITITSIRCTMGPVHVKGDSSLGRGDSDREKERERGRWGRTGIRFFHQTTKESSFTSFLDFSISI